MVTAERFAQGLTLPEYVAQMGVNRERFVRALEAAAIRPDDEQVLERLPGTAKVLVITEDWCGTSIAYIPFVARLVEGRPGIEMRIFLRDANPDIMDRYLKRGLYRSIPVFVFFDREMNELARFIEAPPV
ncbi:MAG TPA: thioredoxin family protein [Candidatus Methylomirabilis sp.]|nr:thioredoxin family protein [Candidatus Methylomirabilis sp.]